MTDETLREKVDALAALDADLHNEDFLLTWEQPEAAIRAFITGADILEGLARRGLSTRIFDTGLGLSIFRDKSTRTRYAFRAACNLLGLATEELDETTSQVAHGETVRVTAAMIGFLSEVVGIRDDMFLGEGHKYMSLPSFAWCRTGRPKSLTEGNEACAGEAGLNMGASPIRRIRLFTTEHDLNSVAVRRGWKLWKMNRRAVTKVNHIK